MRRFVILAFTFFLLACGQSGPVSPAAAEPLPAFPIQRCLNLGNALEAPREGEWGRPIRLDDMGRIARAGFDGVRVPVRWDTHTGPAPTYAIAPAHMARVAQVVDAALDAGLRVVLNVHHFDPLYTNPRGERARFVAIWRQIAARFAGYPPALIFEVLNEPRGDAMTPAVVAALNRAALAEIRPAHPERLVVIGGPQWNSISGLEQLAMPDDPHLAVTVHYYEPHEFSHHRASWMNPAPVFPRAWGTRADQDAIVADFAQAAAAARARGASLFVGEFGVNENVPLNQRAAWTRAVRLASERIGAGWCHWDFQAAFPLYDRAREQWIAPMLDALGMPR